VEFGEGKAGKSEEKHGSGRLTAAKVQKCERKMRAGNAI